MHSARVSLIRKIEMCYSYPNARRENRSDSTVGYVTVTLCIYIYIYRERDRERGRERESNSDISYRWIWYIYICVCYLYFYPTLNEIYIILSHPFSFHMEYVYYQISFSFCTLYYICTYTWYKKIQHHYVITTCSHEGMALVSNVAISKWKMSVRLPTQTYLFS